MPTVLDISNVHNYVEEDGKAVKLQKAIIGTAGCIVGFDAQGNAIAQQTNTVIASSIDDTLSMAGRAADAKAVGDALANAGGAYVYTATIGTVWTENEDTGVKSQTISISGITADNTAKVSNYYNGDGTANSYTVFVEQENQFLDYITNGYAETIGDGIVFYIFGDAPTIEIPILVEVV